MSKQIENLSAILLEDESIISICTGAGVFKYPLVILTDHRLLTVGKDATDNQSYVIDKIESASILEKTTKINITFNYASSPVDFCIDSYKEGKRFIAHLEDAIPIEDKKAVQQQQKNQEQEAKNLAMAKEHEKKLELNKERQQQKDEERKIRSEKNRERIDRMKQKLEDRKLPRLKLQILNGHSKLKYVGKHFIITQKTPGEILFTVNKQDKSDVYYFMGFDRTENIKKSTLDVMGKAYLGRAFGGKIGAMGAAVGSAAKGEDKSTAMLFLVEKATGKDIPLVIKCDSATLEKLSLFIPHAKDSTPQKETVSQAKSVASEIKEFKELLDMDAITQDEFDAKKKQLLGI